MKIGRWNKPRNGKIFSACFRVPIEKVGFIVFTLCIKLFHVFFVFNVNPENTQDTKY